MLFLNADLPQPNRREIALFSVNLGMKYKYMYLFKWRVALSLKEFKAI